ncbi:MAG: 1-acyl-sn-glycerol-3-phosphate acyltransferase [bacterium]
MLSELKELISFRYNDRPMDDAVYAAHSHWIKLLHDYYLRVEHLGHVKEVLEVARKEHVIFISNHAVTLEAALINYFLLKEKAGMVGTLVYPEAFKLPVVREFFRSTHCVPISVDRGVATLKKRHVLLFPEGMDFIAGFVNPNRVPRFHKGFLRMAKKYLETSHKKAIRIVPVAHAGIESTIKLWVIRNDTILDTLVKPFASYPFLAIPKFPFLLPSKVVVNWGAPVSMSLSDLKNEAKITQKANAFRSTLLALKNRAQKIRKMSVI